MKKIIEQIKQLLIIDPYGYHSKKQNFFLRLIHDITVGVQGFIKDKCQEKASALTFYMLLSIVPVFAMAVGMAKGFGVERMLEKQLLDKFPDKKDILGQIFDFANSLLNNTQGGIIAGIGLVLLFWSVMKVMSNIENAFNEIWLITKGRAITRKLSDYFSIVLLTPIAFILSSSIAYFITSLVHTWTNKIHWLQHISWLISFIMKLVPHSLIWFVFAFIYVLMPNTKVKFGSALYGGIVAGIIFQIVQWAYLEFQIGVSQYNAIYGSFAALPLFLVWLQLSWLILLFGAEVSFVHQNPNCFKLHNKHKELSHAARIKLALLITRSVIDAFQLGLPPLTSKKIAEILRIPVNIADEILVDMVDIKVLNRVHLGDERSFAYQPAVGIDLISVSKVIARLETRGMNELALTDNEQYVRINSSVEKLQEERHNTTLLVKDL